MTLRESNTIVVERNRWLRHQFETEPNEAAWAKEAVFFVRALEIEGDVAETIARVQISPDGMHWCDEGSVIQVPANVNETTFVRVRHFGGWLRLIGQMPGDSEIRVIIHLNLKA